MANLARFEIESLSVISPSTDRGFDAVNGATVKFRLETTDALVYRTSYQVFDNAVSDSPLASKDAPELSLVGATTGQLVDAATPGADVTTTMPATASHSWKVRCLANGGINPRTGQPDPDYVFERIVSIRTATGLRKIIGDEGTEYSVRGWADAQNEQVDGAYQRTITRAPAVATGAAPTITVLEAGGGVASKFYVSTAIVIANNGTDRAAWRITTTFLTDGSGNPTSPTSAVEPLPGWTAGAAAWTAAMTTSGNALVMTGSGATSGTAWTVSLEAVRQG